MSKEIIKMEEIEKSVSALTKFEVTKEKLELEVAKTKDITVDNLEDKIQIERVKRGRIDLRNIEIDIEKQGKGYRDIFTKVNKDIMAKQKELLEVTNPEVERLADFEEKAKAIETRKEREMLIPYRIGKLKEVDNITDDETLLEMDDKQFGEYLMEKTNEKIENERLAQVEIDREAQKQKEIKEAEARAKKEAEEKAEKDKVEAKRLADAEIERLKQEAKDKIEAEARAKKDKIKEEKLLAKRKEFITFREELGYSEKTKDDFRQEEIDGVIVLFKKVGEFKK